MFIVKNIGHNSNSLNIITHMYSRVYVGGESALFHEMSCSYIPRQFHPKLNCISLD